MPIDRATLDDYSRYFIVPKLRTTMIWWLYSFGASVLTTPHISFEFQAWPMHIPP